MLICMWPGVLINVSLLKNGLLKTKRMIERVNNRHFLSMWAPLKNRFWVLGFKLPTAAYNPHIFLLNLLHSKHIQLQIYLKSGYMNI